MQLREEGKPRLDDPVVSHPPWFKFQPAGDDDGPITVEQLLPHSSGLQREAGDHWTSLDFPTEAELKALMGARLVVPRALRVDPEAGQHSFLEIRVAAGCRDFDDARAGMRLSPIVVILGPARGQQHHEPTEAAPWNSASAR